MKRRKFLQTTALGCALAITKPALAHAGKDGPVEHLAEPYGRPPKEFELDEVTISDLQDGMRSERFTARSLAKKYLERIDDIDKSGPAINSVIEINPDSLSIAESLDRERKEKGPRGP